MYKLSNIIIILLITGTMNAQVYQAYLDAADKAFETKDFRTAVSYYGEAINLDEEVDIKVLAKYAQSASAYHSYAKAKTAYLQILDFDDEPLKTEALFQLASLSKSTGDYDQAKAYLEKYLAKNDTNELRMALAKKSLEDINWAIDHDTKSIYAVERLGENVNTEFSEMSPIDVDGTLYYSSNNYFASSEDLHPQSKIYANEEEKSSRFASSINEGDAHVGHFTMNSARTITYFTKCNYILGEVICKIFQSDENGNIKQLPQNINPAGTHSTQPNIGVDPASGKEVLYFVSDRSSGKGGTDIYYSPIENGTFKGPYAIERLNTPANEVSPFFHEATNKLYFSTDGLKSFGGLDIHSSYYKDGWGEAINLGSGLNTSYDDAYFSLNTAGTEGYFASNRVGSTYIDAELEACCYDIYSAKLDVVEQSILAKLFDKSNDQALKGVNVKLNALPALEEELFYDASLSQYNLKIRTDLKYDLEAEKKGYVISNVLFEGDIEEELEIYLKPIPLKLNAIVVDEKKEKLGDFIYTISKKDDEGNAKRVDGVESISETITKHTDYTIKVEKDGYYPETISLSQDDLLKEEKLDLDIILKKVPAAVLTKLTLDGYLPLPLYFDNDEPDQNTVATTTTKNYHQTYTSYIQRRGEYLLQNSADLSAEQKIDSDYAVNNFFDTKVKYGDQSIGGFTEHLLRFLQQGSQAEIMLRGYASPRSQSNYNDALTSRRVRSVENHFKQWRGGALIPFIESGQLKLTEKPLGESQAPEGISDELSDKKGSIYSIEASNERRVEILEIKSSNVSPY